MEKIILAEELRDGFLGQTLEEGLIDMEPDAKHLSYKYRRCRFKSSALELFLLYDKLIIPDQGEYFSLKDRFPLEYVKFVRTSEYLYNIFYKSDWYLNRDKEAFRKALNLVIEHKHFVLPKFLNYRDKFFGYTAKTIGLRKIDLISSFIDLAYHYYSGNEQYFVENPLHEALGKDLMDLIISGLETCEPRDGLNSVDTMLFGAMVYAERISDIQNLSEEYEAPVATRLMGDNRYAFNGHTNTKDPSTRLQDIKVVRQVFIDANMEIPLPTNFAEAIKIKKDPNFKAFREKLCEFQRLMAAGDIRNSSDILKEVRKAQKYLRFSGMVKKGLKVTTYAAIPLAVVELLLLGTLPFVGMTASIIATVGTGVSDLLDRKNSWILFGR